jgi:hypothetical protein
MLQPSFARRDIPPQGRHALEGVDAYVEIAWRGSDRGGTCGGNAIFGLPTACTRIGTMVGRLVIGNAAATTLLSGGSLVPAFVADIAVNPGNYENPAEVTHFGSIFPVRGIGPVTMDLAGPVSYVAATSVPLLCVQPPRRCPPDRPWRWPGAARSGSWPGVGADPGVLANRIWT